MLIDHIRSITPKFLHAQHTPPVARETYVADVLMILSRPHKAQRIVTEAMRKLKKKYGSQAYYGFLASLQFLHNLARETKNPGWLDSQFKAIQELEPQEVADFTESYLQNPLQSIQKTRSSGGDTIIWRSYVVHNQSEFGVKFELGAYCLLGLLLLAEKGDAPSEITVTE